MRLAAYEQLSQPESDSAMLILGELAMLEGNLAGEISVQTAMLLVSEMMTSESEFTY
jgi:CheY-specific phosphatase CheX